MISCIGQTNGTAHLRTSTLAGQEEGLLVETIVRHPISIDLRSGEADGVRKRQKDLPASLSPASFQRLAASYVLKIFAQCWRYEVRTVPNQGMRWTVIRRSFARRLPKSEPRLELMPGSELQSFGSHQETCVPSCFPRADREETHLSPSPAILSRHPRSSWRTKKKARVQGAEAIESEEEVPA